MDRKTGLASWPQGGGKTGTTVRAPGRSAMTERATPKAAHGSPTADWQGQLEPAAGARADASA